MPRKIISAASQLERRMAEKASSSVSGSKDVLDKIRLLCLSRGATGILGLGRMFRRMDDDGSGTLTLQEFQKGIHDTGLDMADNDLQELWSRFDHDNSGSIIYEEFLKSLRPPLNNSRLILIEKAFNKLDQTGDGVVNLEDLKKCYSVKGNPEYENGKKTEDEILNSFLAKFEGNSTTDGQLTKDEFIDYYSGVSASIDEDLYFDLMMRKAWKL